MVNFFRSTMSTMFNAITFLYTKEKGKSNITISTPALGFYVFNLYIICSCMSFSLYYYIFCTRLVERHVTSSSKNPVSQLIYSH